MRVRFDEDARREYLDAMVFYSEGSEKIGVKFADAVELAIAKKIGSEPHRFREIEPGVRRCRVTRFPYSILYNVAEDEILILAVKHDRRSPDYWRYRLDR
jgi:plasmid stabilization system protein ParE